MDLALAGNSSVLAKENGVFSINVIDQSVDPDSFLKMARGVYFQEMRAHGGERGDEHAAYAIGKFQAPIHLKRTPWQRLPEKDREEALETAIDYLRPKIEAAGIYDIKLYPG